MSKWLNTSRIGVVAAVIALCASGAQGDVVVQTVFVGNAGNAGELSGQGAGGMGENRICGAVAYVYQMGKFEITTGQYCEFLNAVADADPYDLYDTAMGNMSGSFTQGCNLKRSGTSGNYTYTVGNGGPEDWANWASRPVNWVSWGDAARLANWLHNGQPAGPQSLATTEDGSYYLNGDTTDAQLLAVTRKANATWVIPSEDEWYKAAYHKNDGVTGHYWKYPTQSDQSPIAEVPPGRAEPPGSVNCAYAIDGPYYRTIAGEYTPSPSSYGTFDQGGNLWEWNESVGGGWYRGQRGSSFCYPSSLSHAAVRNSGTSPSAGSQEFGIRLAFVPEPVTISLFVLGALVMLRRPRS